VVIKTDRSDKTEIKKFFLKISGHQQRWPRPLQGPSSYPQLCWWSLIIGKIVNIIDKKVCADIKDGQYTLKS